MYKVFIENKPITFQINSQKSIPFDVNEIRDKIEQFLGSDEETLEIEIGQQKDFETCFDDHKFIEAAGGMVRRKEAFLFIKRNGVWDIPKGKLDEGETPSEAAVREIEEECGLVSPRINEHLIDTWHTYEFKGKKVLKKTYWYLLEETEEADLIPQEEEGITEVVYLNPGEFSKIRANTYLSIIDVMDTMKKKLK